MYHVPTLHYIFKQVETLKELLGLMDGRSYTSWPMIIIIGNPIVQGSIVPYGFVTK